MLDQRETNNLFGSIFKQIKYSSFVDKKTKLWWYRVIYLGLNASKGYRENWPSAVSTKQNAGKIGELLTSKRRAHIRRWQRGASWREIQEKFIMDALGLFRFQKA